MRDISPRQRAVLDAIRSFGANHGRPPTLRELGSMVGIRSTNGVNDHLRALERKGHIRREANKACGIHLVHRPPIVAEPSATPLQQAEVYFAGLAELPLSATARAILGALRLEVSGTLGASDTRP